MWGLKPEEIDHIWQDYRRFDGLGLGKEIAQATLRHVYEELHKRIDLNAYGKMPGYVYFALFLEDWAELKEEAGL